MAARVDYLESQIELIEIKQQLLTSHVNLYKALGGGWRNTSAKSLQADLCFKKKIKYDH
jgi:outer membrane protein TolC